MEKCAFSDDTIIVNIQGDEPMIPGDCPPWRRIWLPAAAEWRPAVPIHDAEEAFNPNAVKVVMDAKGYALYFSRATIPDRDRFAQTRETIGDSLLRHIGIYGYRAGFIRRYVSWAPSPLEQTKCSSSCECCGMARKSMSPWRPKCPAPAWIPRKI